MITAEAFFSETMNTVDNVIAHFVHSAYQNMIKANLGLITLLFTVYIMLLGYQFLFRIHHFDMNTVVRRIMGLLVVYALVMNWELYHLFVYNIFTNEPGYIARILVSAADGRYSGSNLSQAMDAIYASIMTASKNFFSQVTFSFAGYCFYCYGFLVFIIGTLMTVFTLLLFIYAKMMMAIALALGPIFILFYLWDSTRGLFEAWIRKLITMALIPIVTSAVLVLMLSVINVTLPNINLPANELQFYGIAPFLGLSLATTMLLTQVFRICASLGGGLTLASISSGASLVSSGWRSLGLSSNNHKQKHKPNQWSSKQAKQFTPRKAGAKSNG